MIRRTDSGNLSATGTTKQKHAGFIQACAGPRRARSSIHKERIRFVLRLFDNAVAIQLKLVTDLNTVAGCETELRILSEGSLNYLEQLLRRTGSTEPAIARWRTKLERKLVERFSRAKLMALARAKTNGLSSARKRRKSPKLTPRSAKKVQRGTRRTKPAIAKAQMQRVNTRSTWLDRKLSDKEWTSDLDIGQNGGPTYNTVRRYRRGQTSTRDAYVRGKLAKAFGYLVSEVPE